MSGIQIQDYSKSIDTGQYWECRYRTILGVQIQIQVQDNTESTDTDTGQYREYR